MLSKLNSKSLQMGIIGGGTMSQAIITGLLESKTLTPDQISVSDKDYQKLKFLENKFEVKAYKSNADAVKKCDIALLAIKPQDFNKASKDLKDVQFDDKIIMSILAGTTIGHIQEKLRSQKVARLMPNTPCLIHQGMTSWYSENITEDDNQVIKILLASIGKEIQFDEEKFLDMSTALSGSGPAYIFLMAEAMIDSGVHMGIPREKAKLMTYQTILGSIMYAQTSKLHPAVLRNDITSPGGTTTEALKVLEKNGFRYTMIESINDAYQKSYELSKKK